MDAKYLNLRERLTLFFQMQQPLSRNAVCKRAKVSESSIGAYMRATGTRPPKTLSTSTYAKLAAWSHWTVAELMAEAPVPTPNDIASRKTANGTGTGNDSSMVLGQSTHRTTDTGPESEGEDMGDRLLIDILDKVSELQPRHLRILRRHIEAIEGGVQAHPHKAGTAE